MPRSLLEILLEKKDPKKALPYPTKDQFVTELENLNEICTRNLIETFGVEGFGGVNTFGKIREDLKKCQTTLRKFKEEYQDYPWEDPIVQNELLDIRKEIMGEDPDKPGGLLLDLQKARIDSLGEEDSYRIANTYFQTAESVRISGTQKILKISMMRDNEDKVDRARANTDITENNDINKEKYDIVAKKVPARSMDRPADMSDADWEIEKAKREADNKEIEAGNAQRVADVIRLRMGMFDYLATLTDVTRKEVEEGWGIGENKNGEDEPTNDQRKYRKKLLLTAMPFIEKLTERDFDETGDPIEDKAYMDIIKVLASYSPGFKNYEPDPKEEVKEVEITKEQYEVIKTEMTKRQKEINGLIESIIDNHTGNSMIDKIIKEEMEKAQEELKSVAPETACDVNSKRKLKKAEKDLADKVSKNKEALKGKDIEDLDRVANIIKEIFTYCKNKEYTKQDKK